jgi:CheY-like chemotaxis protein
MSEPAETVPLSQRFIVVDDDRVNNLVSKFVILRHNKNAEIHVYTDPELALEGIQDLTGDNIKNPLDTIILLDINMPIMSGWEFLEGFQNLDEGTREKFRIFMFSSSIDPRDRQRAESNRLVCGFFSKPLSTHHLQIACGQP